MFPTRLSGHSLQTLLSTLLLMSRLIRTPTSYLSISTRGARKFTSSTQATRLPPGSGDRTHSLQSNIPESFSPLPSAIRLQTLPIRLGLQSIMLAEIVTSSRTKSGRVCTFIQIAVPKSSCLIKILLIRNGPHHRPVHEHRRIAQPSCCLQGYYCCPLPIRTFCQFLLVIS